MTKKKKDTPTSEKQIEANRRNARLGGVKTQTGKDTSRWNAWKYGHRAANIIGPNEKKEDFLNFASGYVETFRPWNPYVLKLVMRLAENDWRIDRIVSSEVKIMHDSDCREEMEAEINRLSCYQEKLERSNNYCLNRILKMAKYDALREAIPDSGFEAPQLLLWDDQGPRLPSFPAMMPLDKEEGLQWRAYRDNAINATREEPLNDYEKAKSIRKAELAGIEFDWPRGQSHGKASTEEVLPNGLTKAEREQWRKGLRSSRWGLPSKRPVPRAVSVSLKSMQDYVTLRDQLGFPVSYSETGLRELSPSELKARMAARPPKGSHAGDPKKMGSFAQHDATDPGTLKKEPETEQTGSNFPADNSSEGSD